jgi:NADPH:quinone reductase-like Zn-dependent oxidoreductase
VGERVCPIFAQGYLAGEPSKEKLRTTLGGPLDGVLAEYVVVNAESVVRAPPHLSALEAATLPCAGVTAWSALVTQGELRAGQTVLCLGTGGVSIFALQLAKLCSARVIVTSSSDDKLRRARELGADETINYRQISDWGEAARKLTDGVGVDHVIEVGGAKTLAQSVRATRVGGVISIIGMLGGVASDFNVVPILMQNIRLQGVFAGHRESFEAMNRAIELGAMRPVVDQVFPLVETRAALESIRQADHFGKICIEI